MRRVAEREEVAGIGDEEKKEEKKTHSVEVAIREQSGAAGEHGPDLLPLALSSGILVAHGLLVDGVSVVERKRIKVDHRRR